MPAMVPPLASMKDMIRRCLKTGLYECVACSKTSKRRDTINRHLKMVHTEDQKLPCRLCAKSFKNQYCLNIHMKKPHWPRAWIKINMELFVAESYFINCLKGVKIVVWSGDGFMILLSFCNLKPPLETITNSCFTAKIVQSSCLLLFFKRESKSLKFTVCPVV